MKKAVIIVAGGKGNRLDTNYPKQFYKINGKPVLLHTIERFYTYDNQIKIILVLPYKEIQTWKNIINTYTIQFHYTLVSGGQTRFQSVKNGLQEAKTADLIAIHDGVRPLVNHETLQKTFNKAEQSGTAIPVIVPPESIRKLKETTSTAVNRQDYRLVQTPQIFYRDIILKSYQTEYKDKFTDDASVVEASGFHIHLVEGNTENIKITRPIDLKIVEALLK